jgi:hypothetical protein
VELLCKTEPGLEAVCRHALSAHVLVKHIFTVSEDSATESVTAILLAIFPDPKIIRERPFRPGLLHDYCLYFKASAVAEPRGRPELS